MQVKPESETANHHLLALERNLLSTLMTDPSSWNYITSVIESKQISLPNRQTFIAINELARSGAPFNVDAVALYLQRRGPTRIIGLNLVSNMFSAESARDGGKSLVKMILEEYVLQKLHEVGGSLLALASPRNRAAEMLIGAMGEIQRLQDSLACHNKVKSMNGLIAAEIDFMTHAVHEVKRIALKHSSAPLAGLHAHLAPGSLVGLLGKPETGKSTLSVQLCAEFVMNGASTAFFSMKLPERDVVRKFISSIANIKLDKLRASQLNDTEMERLTTLAENLQGQQSVVDGESTQTLAELITKCSRIKRQFGTLDLIIIDRLRCMTLVTNESYDSITHALKVMARKLDCCVLIVSHSLETLHANADVILNLESGENGQRTLCVAKNIHGESSQLIQLPLQATLSIAKFSERKSL